ncbi:FHA domain-containing protein [Calycomorphotria hydatis]|uniref:Glycogen accumulation regulator GarA n=1 Tax=Calycomorphotria hydatis TaxID=2528027 RepID=A0A517T6M7_9PLAN|nr:FHA domain-containing protein [Calycomorphotria hydatis]QDT64021.1 Glycogen accumulation regulator GarA [Calycomorphotria hydatis]
MKYYLIPQPDGKPIALNKAVILIGRHPDCDITVADSDRVSRRHCCVVQVNEHYMLRDLGSTNGVRVNGDLIDKEAVLAVGDEISVGDQRLIFAGANQSAGRSAKQYTKTVESESISHPAESEEFSGPIEVVDE